MRQAFTTPVALLSLVFLPLAYFTSINFEKSFRKRGHEKA